MGDKLAYLTAPAMFSDEENTAAGYLVYLLATAGKGQKLGEALLKKMALLRNGKGVASAP